MWRQHLFSKRVRHPTDAVDGFHTLTARGAEDYIFTKRVLERKGQTRVPRSAFIIDCGDRLFVGTDGSVRDVLGEDHPFSYELDRNLKKNREITFVHGYFASHGTSIPDLDELLHTHPKHLEEILRRANGGEEPVKADQVNFTSSRKPGTEWDKIAREFEKGKRPNEGVTFTTDGKMFRMLEGAVGQGAKIEAGVSEHQAPVQKKTLEPKNIPRVGFLKVISVAVVAVIAGFAAWKLMKYLKEKPNGKRESPSSNGR